MLKIRQHYVPEYLSDIIRLDISMDEAKFMNSLLAYTLCRVEPGDVFGEYLPAIKHGHKDHFLEETP